MNTSYYVLDNRIISVFQGDTICSDSHCNKEINKGEEIITKRSGSGRRRMYHRKCAIALNIIEPEEGK